MLKTIKFKLKKNLKKVVLKKPAKNTIEILKKKYIIHFLSKVIPKKAFKLFLFLKKKSLNKIKKKKKKKKNK